MGVTKLWLGVFLVGCTTKADSEADADSSPSESAEETTVQEAEDLDESDEMDGSSDDSEDEPEDEPEEEVEEGDCGSSWVLTYGLTGRIDVTNTPLGIGNAYADVGGLETDELVLRIPDDGGKPAEGPVVLTSMELLQDFKISVDFTGEISIESYLSTGVSDQCGAATGVLTGSNIEWDQCTFGDKHETNEWSPDEGATGPGCMQDYTIEGVIECIDNSLLVTCGAGWLDDGVNELDCTYNQPMLDLVFDSVDLESFTMTAGEVGVEVPTYTNNRTWMSLEGVLKSMELKPIPACLCPE